jgi:hypothetical protein
VPQTNTYAISFYTVVQDSNVALSTQFRLKRVALSPRPWISGKTTTMWKIKTTFNYGANAVPMLWDSLKLYDKDGVVVDKFYAYCRCRTAPTPTSIPAAAGVALAFDFNAPIRAAGAPTRSPYVVKLHRADSDAVIAFVAPNIVWSKYAI